MDTDAFRVSGSIFQWEDFYKMKGEFESSIILLDISRRQKRPVNADRFFYSKINKICYSICRTQRKETTRS